MHTIYAGNSHKVVAEAFDYGTAMHLTSALIRAGKHVATLFVTEQPPNDLTRRVTVFPTHRAVKSN